MLIETYLLQYHDLNVSANSLANAMGYKSGNVPEQLVNEIKEVLQEGEKLFGNIIGGYRLIHEIKFLKDEYQIIIKKIPFEIHKIIYSQIKKANSIAVFACSAGEQISIQSKKYIDQGDHLRGYVYDVFGSVVVEAAMDKVQEKLKKKMLEHGENISNRFSPGYCGWLVSEQKKLFSLLPKNFCGISLTKSSLMKPIKSVSGIIGIGKEMTYSDYTCNLCEMQNCLYKNLHQKN